MEIQQALDLTYVKVEEVQKKLENISNNLEDTESMLNGTTVNEIKTKVTETNNNLNEISSTINSLGTSNEELATKINANSTKLDTIIENQTGSGVSEELQTSITSTNETCNNISSKVDTINNNTTTINSNTATTNNNVNSIKKTIELIKDNMSLNYESKAINQKLDEIIKKITTDSGDTLFTADPYKLDLEYTTKLEEHRNPTNKDFFEIAEETEYPKSSYLFNIIADCEGSTFDFNLTLSYTVPDSEIEKKISLRSNSKEEFLNIESGTKTININRKNITVKDNCILFDILTYAQMTVHYLKIELLCDNVIILPKRKKYKVRNAYDKIAISKIENKKAYYLILDKTKALYPALLNQEYVLDEENVIDYDYSIDTMEYLNKKYSIEPYKCKINTAMRYSSNYANGLVTASEPKMPSLTCNIGYNNLKGFWSSVLEFFGPNSPFAYISNMTTTSELRNRLMYKNNELCSSGLVEDLTRFNNEYKIAYVITTIKGYNHIYINNNCCGEIGYGKNVTAYYDKDNPNKINMYMNDNGYCVKYILLINNDKTSITTLSKKIIGSYDAYFETNSDIYFVEKNGQLFMYKN